MQKSADKLIKKQLEEETEESLKEALKKSILSPSERKAAGETAKNVMEKRFREMGRAEVFKSEFPEFIGKEGTGAERREHKTVIGYMEKITKKLEEEFGDKFIAIALGGNHTRGYASTTSDMDLDILLRNARTSDLERVSKTARRMKPAGIAIDRLWFDAESVKRDIRETMGSKVEEESIMHAGDMVSPFFVGMNFGDARKIREVRRELIEELSKNPHGERIWERVRELHSLVTVALVHEKGIPSAEEAKRKLGISEKDFRETLEARKGFVLPSFEGIKKQYGVA